MDGVLDGPGDGYGDPVGTVGPGLGCPVSVGEPDGTNETLGWLDGAFETLGAKLGTPSNPLSLAPSPSLSNRLDPSPPILEFIGSFALVSADSPAGSKQKDPTFSTYRHSRPNVQSVLLVHVATHFSSKQWPEIQSVGARQTAPSSSCGSQVPLGSLVQRLVTQSVEEVQKPPTGIMHVFSKKHNPDAHSVLSLHKYPAGDRGTQTARSPVAVASTTAHRSVTVQSVADIHSLGQTPLMQKPVSHCSSAVQMDPAVKSGISSQIRNCSVSCVSPQRCPSRQSSSMVQLVSEMTSSRSRS